MFADHPIPTKGPTPMPKVLITPATLAGVDGPYLQLLRGAGFEPVFPPRVGQLTEDELLACLKDIPATIAGSEPYSRRVLEAHPQLRVIARSGVGYDAVDLQAATERGVAVTTTPGTNQDSVAEHTFALILALAKDLVNLHCGTCAGRWPRRPSQPLRGRTLGIVGLGRIGKAVAVRGAAFAMRLLAYEPYFDAAFGLQYGVKSVSLERVLAESDYLSLHVPLTEESKYLINKKTLALMKPTAYLVNTARGGLVCEADLIEVLRARRIAGAGLDVFELEPPEKCALWEMDNVVLSPHCAGVDLQSRDDMAASAAQSIIALSRGQWPTEQVVNPEVQPRFRW
jgi:phosphoglycerate dehydrogenase-like enzyme